LSTQAAVGTIEGMTPVTLRRAGAADARAAADVWLRSRRAAVPAVPAPVHPDDEVRHHFETVLVPSKETWLAEADGVVVAVLVLDGAEVDQLYVDPDWQRAGIGSELVRLAQDMRPGGLALWTFQSNLRAQRFYERHGFVAVGRTDGSANEERAPDVRYVWGGRRDGGAHPAPGETE
jgi:ribosomal protein S18 acetylase RimI-like enzyme